MCRKPTTWEDNPFHPFCSERCKLIDLGHWASGKYSIPGEKVQSERPAGEEEKEEKEEKK
jgi:hypothetical protein